MPQATNAYLINDSAANAAYNMAKDDYLLSITDDNKLFLRFYDWSTPTMSIGYFQPYELGINKGCDLVRRATGGGLVDHRKDLTFTIVLPVSHPYIACKCESYKQINSVIVSCLNKISVNASLHEKHIDKAIDRKQMACFTTPSIHDVILNNGRKFAGGAQRRRATGLLHQGSIDISLIDRDRDLFKNDLIKAFTEKLAASFSTYELSEKEELIIQKLATEKYQTEKWNKKY